MSAALKPVQTWLASYGDDVWVELIGGLPFLLFDVLIIVILLPVALDWYRRIRTRRLRIVALMQIYSTHGVACAKLHAGATHSALEVDPMENRRLFELAISDARQRVSQSCPLYMGVLDEESATAVVWANQFLEFVMDFLLHHVEYPAEPVPKKDIQQAKEFAGGHFAQMKSIERRINRLHGAKLFDPDDNNRHKMLLDAIDAIPKLRRRGWAYEGPNSILVPKPPKRRAKAAGL